MLSAQLALALQPFIEESWLSLHYLQMLEGNIVEALRLVVAVDFLQLGIEQAGKLIQVLWLSENSMSHWWRHLALLSI